MSINPYESPDTVGQPAEPKPGKRTFTLVELLVVIGVIVILVGLLLPTQRGAREASRRSQCNNNLKQIAHALHLYHDEHGSLPLAYTVDAEGRPLHSWRTLILPYLEQKHVYDKIDLSKPWDDPANKAAFATDIPTYRCPSASHEPGLTTYLAVVAPGGCFSGTEPLSLEDISDDRSLTLMIVEVASEDAVHWMSPSDASESQILGREGTGQLPHQDGSHVAFVDASTRHLRGDIKPATLRALISTDGGDDAVARAAN